MTDARLPERWLVDRRLLKLSDSAHRTFITALLWSVANRTDGVIDPDDLDLMHGARSTDVPELLRGGVLTQEGPHLLLVDFLATQTSRDQLQVLENVRRREREKKARQRAEKPAVPGTVPRELPPGLSPGTVEEGQDRQEGQDRHLPEPDEEEVAEALDEYRGGAVQWAGAR